ncbi:MAG: CBS domain-containing protein [Spirochaetia bacterium]|jgi:CBS domain-containing protein|nr:CBS domain-containing protein [Spirochaetia bacterium]
MGNTSLNSTTIHHNVILDIIYRMKIKEVMTKNALIISPDASIAEAKLMMKTNGVSGLPVVKNRKLSGIISIYDIVECLENGSVNDPVSRHMTRNIIVLEEDMPVSFGLSYFEKYRFRRFPVLNKAKELSGIITSRDINAALLNEINLELQRIDKLENTEETDSVEGKYFKQFSTRKYDFENAGKTSITIKKFLKEIGIPQDIIRRVSIAVYELEINQVVHSNGGTIQLFIEGEEIRIKAVDTGPGIAELENALTEGYSTASEWIRTQGFGAGMGLPNIKKVSDDFQISSDLIKGTEVIIKIFSGKKNETN